MCVTCINQWVSTTSSYSCCTGTADYWWYYNKSIQHSLYQLIHSILSISNGAPSTVGSLGCNQATLVVSVNKEFVLLVRFTVHLKFIEIAVNRRCGEDHAVSLAQLQLGCEAVLHDVSRAVRDVSQRLHYNNNATLKDGLFFPCNCPNDPSTHAVKYLPPEEKCKCLFLSCLSQPNQLWMDKWIKGTVVVAECDCACFIVIVCYYRN